MNATTTTTTALSPEELEHLELVAPRLARAGLKDWGLVVKLLAQLTQPQQAGTTTTT